MTSPEMYSFCSAFFGLDETTLYACMLTASLFITRMMSLGTLAVLRVPEKTKTTLRDFCLILHGIYIYIYMRDQYAEADSTRLPFHCAAIHGK